jgi:L-Ala-D/L-Glu epimerase
MTGAHSLTQPNLIVTACVERWPVAGAFVIARGAKTHVDVVLVSVSDGHFTGWGEGTPIYYHGESAETCVTAIKARAASPEPLTRAALLQTMPAGAARNALDCALWDLESQRDGVPIWQLAQLPEPKPLVSAFTISLSDPATMEADARARSDLPLLKLKLAGEGDTERVAAVRRGAPGARLIVDANEAWDGRTVVAEAASLAALGVEMIEQPVRAGNEASLAGIVGPLPWCADESCQTRASLPACAGRFQAINIKLDKAGGLTEAIELDREARARGFDVMVGCMLGTSLAIGPAFLLAQTARWVDLDGSLLLAEDRAAAFGFKGGWLRRPF